MLASMLAFGCGESQEQSPTLDEDAELVLYPSTTFALVGDDSYVEFTATYGDVDVSDKNDLVVYLKESSGSESLEGNRYNASRAGTYSFYAIYNSVMSEVVDVQCITDLPEEVVDPSPQKYDSFRKRVLGTLATGTWCPNCPYLIDIVHQYEESYGENDDLIMADVHSGGDDIMRCDASDQIATRLSIVAYPTLKFSMSGKTENSIYNTAAHTGEDVKAVVDNNLSSEALTTISANSTIDGDKLCVRADIKIAEQGEFKVGVWLVEDGIYSYQTDAFDDYMHTHNDAIFGAYPMTFSMCESIGGVEIQSANSKHLFYCEFNLKTLTTMQNRDNCEIIVFVYNDDNLIKSVDNVIKFPMGGSYAFEYK